MTKRRPARASRRTKPGAKRSATRRPTSPRTAKTTRRPPPKRRKPAPRPTGGRECTYSHTTFRSQLEARWAIFFDSLELDWDYEPCHYPLGDGLGYLPDFYLPGLGLWVEGKGPTYLDRHAMGKVINAVAGPQPLPLREPPYWPNNGLLLLGPMPPLPDIGRPVHTLVLPERSGVAGAWRSVWTPEGVRPVGKRSWERFAATGTSPSRRPSPTKTAALLTPEPEPSTPMPVPVRRAYEAALGTTFTSDGAAVVPKGRARALLANRRRGRPLRPAGCATRNPSHFGSAPCRDSATSCGTTCPPVSR